MIETAARGCYLPHVMLTARVKQGTTGPEGASPEKSRIAVVDDDEYLREALKGLLRSAGFGAETYASGEEFLRSGGLEETECLILDVRMPGMSGVELRRYLELAGHDIPVIFITAHGDDSTRAQALGESVVGFLTKPFSDDALLEAIGRALGQGGGQAH
jgi:FixJ family two-component response regulator